MVLPVADALTSLWFLTRHLDPVSREKFKERYIFAKRNGIKAAWGVVTGVGLLELRTAIVKGEVVRYGRKKVVALILLGCSHVSLGVIPMIINSTKVIKYAKKAHSVTAAIYRCAHNASEVPLIVLDFLVFGEYVPSCPDDGYMIHTVSSDILSEIDNFK